MSQKRKMIMVILVFIVVIAGAYMAYNMLSSNYEGKEEIAKEEAAGDDRSTMQKAKGFVAYDEDGNKVSPSDYIGEKPVILNFWASWCPPCKLEMPDFQKMQDQYGDSVEILMVNLTDGQRETKETAKEYMTNEGYNLKIIYDTDYDGANTYVVQSVPRTIIIDKEGYQVKSHVGVISEEELTKYITQILE